MDWWLEKFKQKRLADFLVRGIDRFVMRATERARNGSRRGYRLPRMAALKVRGREARSAEQQVDETRRPDPLPYTAQSEGLESSHRSLRHVVLDAEQAEALAQNDSATMTSWSRREGARRLPLEVPLTSAGS